MTTDDMTNKLLTYCKDCDRHALSLKAQGKDALAEIRIRQGELAARLMSHLDDLQREFEEMEGDRPPLEP